MVHAKPGAPVERLSRNLYEPIVATTQPGTPSARSRTALRPGGRPQGRAERGAGAIQMSPGEADHGSPQFSPQPIGLNQDSFLP